VPRQSYFLGLFFGGVRLTQLFAVLQFATRAAMNSDRWHRIEQVYDAVLTLPPEQRLAVLEARCGADAELRREVESLLSARDPAGDFLSPDNLLGHIATVTEDAERPAVGGRLGPYEILAAIGAGAMGEVYRARDTRLDRIVAPKVLPARLVHDPGRSRVFNWKPKPPRR
jgi:hypothetical protein